MQLRQHIGGERIDEDVRGEHQDLLLLTERLAKVPGCSAEDKMGRLLERRVRKTPRHARQLVRGGVQDPVARAWRGTPALRTAWRLTSQPAAAWVLHTAALWVWHAPRLYEAAVRNEAMHALEEAAA